MWLFGGIITLSKFWVKKRSPGRHGRCRHLPCVIPGAGDNVLRLLGSISMPAEPFPRLDLINDRGRRRCPVAAIHGESTSPMN
jgi:hypothetical protein